MRDTELSHAESMYSGIIVHVKKMAKLYTIISLSLDDTGVSQQMAFISGQATNQQS